MKKMEKKYIPLAQFFEACTQSTFTLTYEEIQNIMGHELPNAAYLNVSWWKKTKAPSTHYFAWINNDYYVINVTLGISVTFSCAEQEEAVNEKPQNTYITRAIEANDARAYINLQEALFAQSSFGYYAAEERNLTVQQVRKTITDWRKEKTSTVLLCIYNGQSAPAAFWMYNNLMMLREQVFFIQHEADQIARQLAMMDEDSLLVVISLDEEYEDVATTVEIAKRKNVQVIAIRDKELQVPEPASTVLYVPSAKEGGATCTIAIFALLHVLIEAMVEQEPNRYEQFQKSISSQPSLVVIG